MDLPPPPPELVAERPYLEGERMLHPETTGPIPYAIPKKYTKAVHERICDEIRRGQRPQGACARAGIAYSTFQSWMERAEGNPVLEKLKEDVEIATHAAEANAVDVITNTFTDPDPDRQSPEDAKWFLERARPAGYSKQVKTEVEGQIQAFMMRLEANLAPEIFQQVLAVYLGHSHTLALPKKANLLVLNAPPEEDNSGT